MTTHINPNELRYNWAPGGIPKGEQAPSSEGNPDLPTSSSVNPGIAGGSLLHAMVIIPKLPASLDSEASSGWLGACSAVGHTSQDFGSSYVDPISSAWLGEVMVSSYMTSNTDTPNRSSPSMRGTTHLCRSWMVWQSTPGGATDHMAHCWRAQASPTVSSCLSTWMS